MTVITTLISRCCTVHSTDSFITSENDKGTFDVIEKEKRKFVHVEPFRGAMAYFGLAKYEYDGVRWSTYEWLEAQSKKAKSFSSPEDFAQNITEELNHVLASLPPLKKPNGKGIGIHFTAYEWIADRWIPELFVLSNFCNPSYSDLHAEGVLLYRQTYNLAYGTPSQPEHREPLYRLAVQEYLQKGTILLYNNGDPLMFNPIAKAMLTSIFVAQERKILEQFDNPAIYRKIARTPVEIVSDLQTRFIQKGKRKVGGKPHDLSITPTGIRGSDSGDAR